MNVFERVMLAYELRVRRLGTPLPPDERAVRDALYGQLNPSGWKQVKVGPRTRSDGTTRGDRKRWRRMEMREAVRLEQWDRANNVVSDEKDDPFGSPWDYPDVVQRFGSLKQ